MTRLPKPPNAVGEGDRRLRESPSRSRLRGARSRCRRRGRRAAPCGPTAAGCRTGQSRSPRNGRIGSDACRPACVGEVAKRRLQLLLRRLQLADQLRVEIAAAVDVANQSVACVRRLRRAPTAARSAFARSTFNRRRRSSSVARALSQLVCSVRCAEDDAIAIDLGERGQRARRLADLADVASSTAAAGDSVPGPACRCRRAASAARDGSSSSCASSSRVRSAFEASSAGDLRFHLRRLAEALRP